MITMFIRTEDKFSGDWFKDLGRHHRGHVVEVLDGIRSGGKKIESASDIKTLHIDMPLSEGVAFTAAELGDIKDDFTLRRRRMFRIDLVALISNIRNIIEDTSKPSTIDNITMVDAIRAVKVEIPKLINPNIIGTEAEDLFTVG